MTAADSQGTVVIDEVPYPIVGILLQDGQYVTAYRVDGPLQAREVGSTVQLAIIGPDGIEVCSGRCAITAQEAQAILPGLHRVHTAWFKPTKTTGSGGPW